MAQLQGSHPWQSLWCSYLSCCFSQKQNMKKKKKNQHKKSPQNAQIINWSAALMFLCLCRSVTAKFPGGQIFISISKRVHKEDFFSFFCCICVVSCQKKKKKIWALDILNEHCPWIKAQPVHLAVQMKRVNAAAAFENKCSWTHWSHFFFVPVLSWANKHTMPSQQRSQSAVFFQPDIF